MALNTPYPMQNSQISFGALPIYQMQQEVFAQGCFGYSDHLVIQRGVAAMACVVQSGVAYVNMEGASGGLRRVYNDANSDSGTPGSVNSVDWTATFTAADSTNPRLDSVYLIVRDSTIDATGAQDAKYTVVAGTAQAGVTLDNRTGAGSAPANSILLADVLIPAGSTTVTTANIRDRRPISTDAAPPLFTAVDMVPFEPVVPSMATAGALLGATNAQAAAPFWLPRRIVNATRVRWGYRQTATPTTGTWNIAICDASGRPIQATGATAFAGAASTDQLVSQAITATTFEAGLYWILYGQVLTAGASVLTAGVFYKSGTADVPFANAFAYRAAATGTTFPSAINGTTNPLADAAATPSNVQYGVPTIALSVG